MCWPPCLLRDRGRADPESRPRSGSSAVPGGAASVGARGRASCADLSADGYRDPASDRRLRRAGVSARLLDAWTAGAPLADCLMELSSATTCQPASAREMLMPCRESHDRTRADSQVQDRDSHGIDGLRLFRALTGGNNAGRQDALLVSGSRIFPDTEEVTSSNLVPPTSSRRSRPFSARSERPAPFEGEPFGSRAGSSGHGCTPWPEPGLHLLRPHGAQAPWVLSKSVRTPRSARHDARSLMVRLAGRGLAVRTR
jgi:hypothetical protein